MKDLQQRIEAILPQVSRPTRYLGNELNVRPADYATVSLRLFQACGSQDSPRPAFPIRSST